MKNTVLIGGCLLCASALAAQERPNVIWMIADDMRGSSLELLGREPIQTPPHLNSLARDCMVFSNAHIMGGTSGAVSMPSRAMIMTGKYLYNLEGQGSRIPEDHITVGEAFRSAGYQTFHTGKWHSDHASFNRTFSSGEDIFFGGMADHWNVPLYHYHEDGVYQKSRKVIPEPLRNNEIEIKEGEYAYSGRHSVDIFTETAIDFISGRRTGDQPFFMTVCYMSPHDPRSMPEQFMELYDKEGIALPSNFMEQHPFDNGELRVRDEVLAATPREPEEVRKHIAEYYAMITHLDDGIGRVVEALKASGQYDNTIIVFMADNGLAVGQHGLMGKQNLYEHSVNVPLMIKPAGDLGSTGITEELCYLIDLYPTMCEMAGIPVLESVDGISLIPVLEEQLPVRSTLYLGYRNFQRAVTDGHWKLIEYNVGGDKHTQLFNLKDDPWETTDLSADKKHRKRIEALRAEMVGQRDITGDDLPFWD